MRNIERVVSFTTKFNVLKRRPELLFMSFMFIIFPIFMSTIFTVVFSSLDRDMPKVDYDEVIQNAAYAKAEVLEIETIFNTTINGEHPSVITYSFQNGVEKTISKTKILNPNFVASLNKGDYIDVAYYQEQSVISGIKPYSFPIDMMMMPLIFLLFGLPVLLYLLYVTNKTLKLYKFGNVVEAELVSMAPKSSFGFSSFTKPLQIHYQYKLTNGNKVLGSSLSADYSIMNEYKQGDSINIFVSPENETDSCFIPKLESLRNNWGVY